ncbi:MAG: diacylglycerol/polyprenol kinase family protein [Candidatus Helarchaeota archaeon]
MVDIWALSGFIITIITFLILIIITSALLKRSHQIGHAESFYSLLLCIISFVFAFIITMLYIKFDYVVGFLVVISTGSIFLFFGVSNSIHYLLTRNRPPQPAKEIDFSTRNNLRHELIRKIFHIILFFGIIAMLIISYFIVEWLYLGGATIPGLEETYDNFWGNLNGLGMQEIHFDFGQSINFMFFFILSMLFILNEGARLGNWFYFPFQKVVSIGIREKEKDAVASYVYFTIGMVFASSFVFPVPFFSIIGILCFADTAASLVGRKYGRHKIQFNRTKSWEGSIGGIAVCLLVTILFVGPIWGIAATLVFFGIDAITPRIPVSDNIAIPIGVASIYFLLSVFQIPMYSIIFSFI